MRRVIVSIPDKPQVEGKFLQFGSTDKGTFMIVELDDGSLTAPYIPYVKFKPLRWWERIP